MESMPVVLVDVIKFNESNVDHKLILTARQNFEDILCSSFLSEFRKEKEELPELNKQAYDETIHIYYAEGAMGCEHVYSLIYYVVHLFNHLSFHPPIDLSTQQLLQVNYLLVTGLDIRNLQKT